MNLVWNQTDVSRCYFKAVVAVNILVFLSAKFDKVSFSLYLHLGRPLVWAVNVLNAENENFKHTRLNSLRN